MCRLFVKDMFNLLPDVTNTSLVRSLSVKTNDQMLVVYLASLVRSVIALHNLINNKLANTDAEKKEGGTDAKAKKDTKDKETPAKDEDKEKESVAGGGATKKESSKKWDRTNGGRENGSENNEHNNENKKGKGKKKGSQNKKNRNKRKWKKK